MRRLEALPRLILKHRYGFTLFAFLAADCQHLLGPDAAVPDEMRQGG